jgi:hypothetical protein
LLNQRFHALATGQDPYSICGFADLLRHLLHAMIRHRDPRQPLKDLTGARKRHFGKQFRRRPLEVILLALRSNL